ncbi:hypothetical protein V8E54_011898 [Elaphomyces granulatus]
MDTIKQFKPAALPTTKGEPYFWGLQIPVQQPFRRIEAGYQEARRLSVNGTFQTYEQLLSISLSKLAEIYNGVDSPTLGDDKGTVADISLSAALQAWRRKQFDLGRTLPSKGHGIARVPTEVIQLLRIETWPEPLLTNAALFGYGLANMLIGGHDPATLYSNYCADMVFFYEHGYDKVFPEYEPLLEAASSDAHALQTVGGRERRAAVDLSLRYIRGKIAFEEKLKANLAHKAAKLRRRGAVILNFCDSSMWGLAAEAMARGFDKAGVINDFAASRPCSDALDLGSDLINSEVLNTFLNAADITESGVVTEEVLRKVYDAYAHTVSKMFTERYAEPGAKGSSVWYVWHIINDRHMFLRRAILGYPKVRVASAGQREADFDEAFDQDLRTTGFSRRLKNACNGQTTCDHVKERLAHNPALGHLWNLLSTEPLRYAAEGVVSDEKENELADAIRVALARVYSLGLVDDMAWLLAHASQHAWQVNYLMEAAMFGSLLDDGGLEGKLDRREE